MTDEFPEKGDIFRPLSESLPSSSPHHLDDASDSFSQRHNACGLILSFDSLPVSSSSSSSNGCTFRFDFFGLLLSLEHLSARNGSPYQKLTLQDIFGNQRILCIFADQLARASSSLRSFLEALPSLSNGFFVYIHSLHFDGRYFSISKDTLFESAEHHPLVQTFHHTRAYLRHRCLPSDNREVFSGIISSASQTEQLFQSVKELLMVHREDLPFLSSSPSSFFPDFLLAKLTGIIYRKVYTGTRYLLVGEDQLVVTPEYQRYLLSQLRTLLEAFLRADKPLSKVLFLCLLERWELELVSFYDFQKVEAASDNSFTDHSASLFAEEVNND